MESQSDGARDRERADLLAEGVELLGADALQPLRDLEVVSHRERLAVIVLQLRHPAIAKPGEGR